MQTHNKKSSKPQTLVCVCSRGFMMWMKGRALVNIDECCHSVLLTEAHLEMRGMTFTTPPPHTHTHTLQHRCTQKTYKKTHQRLSTFVVVLPWRKLEFACMYGLHWLSAHREHWDSLTPQSLVSALDQFIPNGPLVFSKSNRFLGNQQVIHHTYK